MPFNFIGDTVQLHDQSDSGEPITIIYARTDNEKVPVFFFFSFKTAPHAWIVYFVGGRSKLPADYLGLAKR